MDAVNTLPVVWRPSGSTGAKRALVVMPARRLPPARHDPLPPPIPGRGAARLRAAYGLEPAYAPLVDVLA